ncbi:M48 family metallopeptidase [Henriciella aquimarina]|uniref:M48 family metallopeptidase n=1 Tax=Henriciella aquimarina TaxID=545261 RepID=UPI001F27FC6D|nr:SprT family zinc-dependent metalloprotease [Henriciella aquimarina]
MTSACGLEIPVRIEVNPRAKRLILRLDEQNREAVAVCPSKRFVPAAARFAEERLDWAASRLRKLPPVARLAHNKRFLLKGSDCLITLEGEGRKAVLHEGEPHVLSLPGDPETIGRRAERFLRTLAKSELTRAVDQYCATLEVDARRVTVKDTRSRWGSCTSDGRLAFSWRLIMAPPEVLDYVAAHECAHLLEMNHSPRFWAHVERCRPHWKQERAWLRRHGSGLHAVSA